MSATKKLTAAQARSLVAAEVAVSKLEAGLEQLKVKRQELRDRYKLRIPPSEESKDAGKDVRQIKVGGFRIRVSTYDGGEYFKLREYREAGHTITDEMKPFIGSKGEQERWTWKDLGGPKRPDAVEPT